MRVNAGILIIFIGLLFLVGAVAGYLPDTSTITTNNPWIIANGGDQSTITVLVSNSTHGPMQGANVIFTIDNPIYGTISPSSSLSDANGIATSTFKVNTKSGVAVITAVITSADGYTVTRTVNQNIDHDIPYIVTFTHPQNGTVATEVPFNLSIADRHGNPIDNRKEVALGLPLHSISLHVHGPGLDDGNFVGYGHDISPTLDANGYLSVNVKLTSKIGYNYILMDSFGSISDKIESITAVATGIPFSMTGTLSPAGPILANNIDTFTIDYFIYDEYGNPLNNKQINWTTSLPGDVGQGLKTSNSNGQIQLPYGPKVTVTTVTLTAISIDNTSVKNVLYAEFTNAEATTIVLTVTPQIMISRDAKPTEQAFVRATLIDNFGNPVPNQLVTFSLGTVSAPGFTQNLSPELSGASATTDSDGNAIVMLYPGSFAAWGEPGYKASATGNVVVTATWNGNSKSVTTTWKNYAFLNIETSAEPSTVNLSSTVDITIDVIGDGPSLQGGNVAAMLDIDSSSSMWHNSDTPGPYRMDSAKTAANAFSTALLTPAPTSNWIGVDSFGYTKKVNPFLLSPQNDISLVQNKIDNIVEGSTSQGMVDSIIDSINNLSETQGGRPLDKVRAVVVLKDTADGGTSSIDPTAMVNLAKSTTPQTWVFIVYYHDGGGIAAMKTYLNNTATSTGGQYFDAADSAELTQVFKDIAEILKTKAGVDASVNLNFQNVEVNGNPIPGTEAFSYIFVGPEETMNSTIVSRDSVFGRTRIFWMNSSHSVKDQSLDWTSHVLHFNIGTVNVSERWNATYRLRPTQTGLINLFNCSMSGSSLIYNENPLPVCLPDLYITVKPDEAAQEPQGALDLSNLIITKSGNITDYVPLAWNLKYTGHASATETMWYSYNNGPWVQFGTVNGIAPNPDPAPDYTQTAQLDVKKSPPGGYRIKVHVVAPDAPDDEEITATVTVGSTGIFIKLE